MTTVSRRTLYVSPQGPGAPIQAFSLEDQSLQWEVRYDSSKTPWHIAMDEQTQTLGALVQCSAFGWTFELVQKGNPVRSYRFVCASHPSSLAVKGSTFAAAYAREIFIWRFLPTPKKTLNGLAGKRRNLLPIGEGQRLVGIAPRGDRFSLFDISDPQGGLKKLPAEFSGWDGAAANLASDKKGRRIVFHRDRIIAAYSYANDQIEALWPPKDIRSQTEPNFALHPTEDLLWFEDKVLKFSTGGEVASLDLKGGQVKDFISLNGMRAKSGVWVGADHLATPVVSAAKQKMLVLWNAKTGVVEAKVPAIQISALEASLDGKWVVEGGADKRIRIRNGKTLEVEREFRVQDGSITGLAWHPRLPILATASGTSVRLWSTENWKMLEEIRLESAPEPLLLDIPGEEGRRMFVWIGGGASIFEPQCFQKNP